MAQRVPSSPRSADEATCLLLRKNVEDCLTSLQELHVLATEKPFFRRIPHSVTLQFLNERKKPITSLLEELKKWQREIESLPSLDQEGVNQANTRLTRLKYTSENAKSVMNDRVGLYTLGTSLNEGKRKECEDKLDGCLKELKIIVEDLSNLIPYIKRPPLQVQGSPTLYQMICGVLRDYKNQGLRHISMSDITMLWDAVPINEKLENFVSDPIYPGDGESYTARDLANAEQALNAMYYALRTTFGAEQLKDGFKELVRFKNIFIILLYMEPVERRHFDSFIRHYKYTLPLEESEVVAIVGREARDFIRSFCAEQYRLVRRLWPDNPSDIVSLDAREPLPFIKKGGVAKEGSFGTVYEVKDIFTGENLVHKTQKSASDDIKSHFLEEIKILGKLLGVRHVAQLRRSYFRNDRYGFLLQPGTANLHEFLGTGKKLSQQQSIDAALSKAFGCLCWSLSKIHAKQIRHKDIKPGNIVIRYHRSRGNIRVDDYFIIDFSVAYDFYNKDDSRQKNSTQYSPTYAAPEIMKAHAGQEQVIAPAGNGASSIPQLDTVSHASSPKSEVKESGAGTKADVFSLGLVLLEILSVFMGEPHQAGSFWNCSPFYERLPELYSWIGIQIVKLKNRQSRMELIPILEICRTMVQYDPEKRYSAKEAALKFAKADSRFCCSLCAAEMITKSSDAT